MLIGPFHSHQDVKLCLDYPIGQLSGFLLPSYGVITLVVFGSGTGKGTRTGTRTMGDIFRCRPLSLKFITCEHNNIGDGLNFVTCEQSFKHNA